MVKNIWCRKLCRDIASWPRTKSHLYSFTNAKQFTEPRYQNNISLGYINYRVIILLLWTIIILCSMFEIGSFKPHGHNYLWPIYLTNWDLTFGFVQSILGFIIVKKRWNLQKQKSSSTPTAPATATADHHHHHNLKYDKIVKLYWFFYTVTLTLAIGVTASYWILVYNPKYHSIDPLNIMIHVCNSILIICDFIVTNVPLKYRHFWWSISIILIYIIFTIIYFIAGGTDKRGKHCIYDAMDWNKPIKTILLTGGAIICLIIVHCLLCYLTIIKERLYSYCENNKNHELPINYHNNDMEKFHSIEIV
ncbi:protein rolling stone-like isoform X2 [Aphidius gifuensis]|nr:protein rolling stone-like isoform X2 [Aphidius gifuensis]XP_044013736.1 protein rolling stone-like isoform X2 [Aphidius gifuensis]